MHTTLQVQIAACLRWWVSHVGCGRTACQAGQAEGQPAAWCCCTEQRLKPVRADYRRGLHPGQVRVQVLVPRLVRAHPGRLRVYHALRRGHGHHAAQLQQTVTGSYGRAVGAAAAEPPGRCSALLSLAGTCTASNCIPYTSETEC